MTRRRRRKLSSTYSDPQILESNAASILMFQGGRRDRILANISPRVTMKAIEGRLMQGDGREQNDDQLSPSPAKSELGVGKAFEARKHEG